MNDQFYNDRMKFHELEALWWMHAATNGHAATRKIVRGDGSVVSPEELRDDAMAIAQQHIHLFNEIIDNKYKES